MKIEAATRLNAASTTQIGYWLRIWTSSSIFKSNTDIKNAKIQAAHNLSNVAGQKFPSIGYRAFAINSAKVQS